MLYDYGPGTNSEKYITPYVRLSTEPERELTIDEIFALPEGTPVLYQGVESKVDKIYDGKDPKINISGNSNLVAMRGAKRAILIKAVLKGGTRRIGGKRRKHNVRRKSHTLRYNRR